MISGDASKYSSPESQINEFLQSFEEDKKEKYNYKYKINFDMYKSNAFSLGLIILELLGIPISELTSSIKLFTDNIINNINDFSVFSILKYKSLIPSDLFQNNDIKNSFKRVKQNIITANTQVKSLDLRIILHKALTIYSSKRIGLKNMLKNIHFLLDSLNNIHNIHSYKQNSDLNQFISHTNSDNIKIWHSGSINYLKFLNNSNHLITSGRDNTIRLWNIKKNTYELLFFLKHLEITSIDVSPDGQKLVAWYSDNKLRIWNIDSRCLINEISVQKKSLIRKIEISKNSKYAATNDSECFLLIVDFENKGNHETRWYASFEVNHIICMCIDPTSEIIAVGEKGGSVCIWWIHEKKQMSRIDAYDTEITCISFI